jgi:FkbM family methyltransferase
MPALSPEQFVIALYRCCLGRDPEPEGLADWSESIRRQSDPTVALAGIIASDEFQNHRAASAGGSERIIALATQAQHALGRTMRVVDVGAQLLGLGSNPYDPLARYAALDIVGFDPLEERLAQRLKAEGKEGLTLLPYTIGDGESHVLHVNNDDATSSLFPLHVAQNALFNHISGLQTVEKRTVKTERLDDVLPPGDVDFLKLDVQGAELMVLRSSQRTLERTAVVHCEVEFSPIYEGQPLYPEVQVFLNQHGFELIDLLVSGRYHYVQPETAPAPDRLIWADAVFFRGTDDPDTLHAQSVIAAAVYGKPTLAAHLMFRASGQTMPPSA